MQRVAAHPLPSSAPAAAVLPARNLNAFAWGVLAYNVLVIVWGALVRATSSGAGCGGHWPLCNGDVLPSSPQTATVIEFTHRLMSGAALAAVAALWIWTRRAHPAGEPWGPRRWAALSLVFIVTEALLGAGLVLLGYVAQDQSAGRAYWLCAHLINTFALLGSLAMTAWTLRGEGGSIVRTLSGMHAAALAALTCVAMAGVITALGDTLFPSDSLARGIEQDFSSGAPFLIRLRVIHPALAILTGALIAWLAVPAYRARKTRSLRILSGGLMVLTLAAVCAGALTLALRAPVAMQLVHLSIADALWITLVLFTYESLRTAHSTS